MCVCVYYSFTPRKHVKTMDRNLLPFVTLAPDGDK